jgi:hypothetical protein
MAGRAKQMLVSNSGEHKVNHTVKLHKRDRVIKSVANLAFIRGDQVYDHAFD